MLTLGYEPAFARRTQTAHFFLYTCPLPGLSEDRLDKCHSVQGEVGVHQHSVAECNATYSTTVRTNWIWSEMRGVYDVVWWLMNVAVSEMSILRMRACGQLAININIYTSLYISRATPRSFCTSDSICSVT